MARPGSSTEALAEAATRLFVAAGEANVVRFWQQSLPTILPAAQAEWAGVFHGEKGLWRSRVPGSASRTPPDDLLAEVISEEQPGAQGDWHALPLGSQSGEVLALYRAKASSETLLLLGEWLAAAAASVRTREQEARRGQQLASL